MYVLSLRHVTDAAAAAAAVSIPFSFWCDVLYETHLMRGGTARHTVDTLFKREFLMCTA